MPPNESALLNEQVTLRNELQELKKCQIQYFLISLAVTGAVFGFNKEIFGDNNNKATDLIFLAPLIVVLPCWLTFFDKATTITRLTGYVRVFIEEPVHNGKPVYIGYETALSIFRLNEKTYLKETKASRRFKKKDWATILKPTRHQYWKINWFTFLFLSLTCYLYPFLKDKNFFSNAQVNPIVFPIFVVAGAVAGIYSYLILKELLVGKFSYDHVTKYWRTIFDCIKKSN